MRECPTCGLLFNADDARICPEDSSELVPMGEADPLIGRQLGSYRIERRLGRGGMGTIYAAVQPAIGSTVAIKVLHRKYATDTAIVERFFNEARAVNLIGHENIVRVFDFGHLEDGTPYLVMELLVGRPLSAWCGEPRPVEQVIPIVLQIARALGAAHDAGVVHRDLKPDNIFLCDGEDRPRVKVLDFGIAKLQALPGVSQTESGAVLGSARYLSPEQAAGDRQKIGPASDVYSLGVILFELLCGRVPFEATTYGDLLVAHRTQSPPMPRRLVPTIPVWLNDVALRCLEKDPEARFGSMQALVAALLAQASPAPARSRSRAPVVIIATAALTLGVVVWLSVGTDPSASPPGPQVAVSEPPSPMAAADAGRAPPAAAQEEERPPGPPPSLPEAVTPVPKRAISKPTEPRYTIPEKVGDGMIEVEW